MLDRCTRALALIAGSVMCSYALATVQPSAPPAPPLAVTQSPPSGPLGDLYARIRRALTHADQGEPEAARQVLDAVVVDPVFSTLQPAHQRELLSMNAVLAWEDDDTARAAELMRAATAADGNMGVDFLAQSAAFHDRDRLQKAVLIFAALLRADLEHAA